MPKAAHDQVTPPPVAQPFDTHRVLQRFAVPYEYTVTFTRDVFDPANPALVDALTGREPDRRQLAFAVMDAGFDRAWPEVRSLLSRYFEAHRDRLRLEGDVHLVPGGEAAKNDPTLVPALHALFAQHHLDRHAFVLVVGGGGVQDAVGYAAATAHRGIRTVRLPTTVLSQNDSGVGVKNGINAFGAKNFIGTFAPPYAVVSDLRFLERLPARDRIAGMAEAVKVSLIRDAAFFRWLDGNASALAAFAPDATALMVRRCAELHLAHIAGGGDPFEQGSARPLDFGHWAAHKLEALTAHELRHGEAVAIGLCLDSRYSVETGLLPEAEFARLHALLGRLGLPRWHDALLARGPNGGLAVLDGIEEFREHLGGELTVTMLRAIGRGIEVHELDRAVIERCLRWMRTASLP